jgi:ABC-2 type transport system permease protein
MVLANGYDWYRSGTVDTATLWEPLAVTVTMACISSAAAVLFGTLARSVLVGVILTIYGGNQLSAVLVLPALQNMMPLEATVVLGLVISAVVLVIAVTLFKRKLSS